MGCRSRVTDEATGKQKASVNLPMGMINMGLKTGAKFAPEMKGLNVDEVLEAIKSGAPGIPDAY